MAENVQCPVCTLFLHAGMSLTDHLETHPKEQVIKALVNMTISKVDDGETFATAALTAALNAENSKNVQQLSSNKIDEEIIVTTVKDEPQLNNSKNISSIEKQSSDNEITNVENLEKCNKQQQQAYQKSVEEPSTSKSKKDYVNYVVNNRCQQQTQKSPPNTNINTTNITTINSNTSERSQLPNSPIQQQVAEKDNNNLLLSSHHHMSRSLLPPPPPPPPLPPPSQAHAQPQTSLTNPIQYHNTILPYANIQQQQQQQQTQQQQQHLPLLTQRQMAPSTSAQQSSNMKIIYSPTLPPPPPLQLFQYQTAQHTPQHQKPPPAYVTAISQIRSQHNQNKHQLYNIQQQTNTTTSITTTTTKESIAATTATTSVSSSITTLSTTNQRNSLQQNTEHQQRVPNSIQKSSSSTALTTDLITTATTSTAVNLSQEHINKQQHQQQQQTHYMQNYKKSLHTVSIASNNTELTSITTTTTTTTTTPTTPITNKSSLTSPIQNNVLRQTNSPFSTLLTTPSSSSSVLRYAESPVAHYLERDNGDFIVQETPKHIVECVETDNGEFSVIERIYQSPPSVLHIHEYDEDDDDDDDEDDHDDDRNHDDNDHTANDIDNNDDNCVDNKPIDMDMSKSCKDNDEDDDDDDDFMSIQTDTNTDDEEFIKNTKNIEKTPTKSSTSTTPSTSTSTTNLTTPTSSRKKSSKNSITVLSDVQLNLNEYLDLMGNIVASSKISQNKQFAHNLPIPMVKTEKEDTNDEYDAIENSDNYVKDLTTTTTTTTATKPPNKTISNYNNKRNNNKNNSNCKNKTDELMKNNNNNSRQNKKLTNKKDDSNNNNSSDGSENNINNKSSHVTSVIRMVTTTPTISKTTTSTTTTTLATNKDDFDMEQVAEDLTQIKNEEPQEKEQQEQLQLQNDEQQQQITEVLLPPPLLLKKGPKKLIIKPKSTKTEQINSTAIIPTDDEKPTTSAAAAAAKQLEIEVKDEPITSNSILEKHLKRNQKDENIEEKPLITNSENNVAEDARVLLEFAHSKKRLGNANFLSSSSIFSNPDGRGGNLLRCENDFIPVEQNNNTNTAVQDIVISSSYASSQEATDISINNPNINTNEYPFHHHQHHHHQHQHHHHHHQQQQQQQQQQQSTYDIPFTFLYGNGAPTAHSTHQHVRTGNISPLYQQTNDAGTTAATLASGSNSLATTLDDSSSTHASRQPNTHHHHSHAQQWYHPHVLNSGNADFETALAVDCNNVDVMGSKYLDLDTCKRENSSLIDSVQVAPSSTSTSSSFAAVTENSLAGGCTTDALNIRTDEKMPAKGEISEQESNCDIENSWSQPMFGDYPGRFFKNSFPGIFNAENCWNQDEYLTIHDLTTPNTNNQNNNNNNNAKLQQKSFDFRLPLEATTSAAANSSNNINLQLFSQLNNNHHNNNNNNNNNHNNNIINHIDNNFPTTSLTNNIKTNQVKKKRKRLSQQPTATVTSQQLLMQQQQQQQQQQQPPSINDISIQNYQQSEHQQEHLSNVVDLENILAGPSIASTSASTSASASASASSSVVVVSNIEQSRQKARKKVYQCAHCSMQYAKLKDRTSHMILQHNYVRKNRRLILAQNMSSDNSELAIINNINETATISQAFLQDTAATVSASDYVEDSKHDIVKIEMTELHIESNISILANNTNHIATNLTATATTTTATAAEPLLDAKSEFIDDKTLAHINGNGGVGSLDNDKTLDKNKVLPLAVTTPATKLATLYRMLVSYNMDNLRRNQNVSEIEDKLMKSSIFFCYVCRCNFTSVKLYDAHLTEHPAECFTCGKKFQRWKNFSLHLKRHLGWKEFGCNVCEKKFVVRSALVEHMRMHTGQTPLKCKICGKNFKRYSNLTQHRKRHVRQIVRKKEYVCYCGEVLPSKARFLWHKETHDAKPKCCPYCCDRFVHANSLRRHIRLAHSDKFDYTEPMECPMCKQIFAKSSIKAHMATHSMDTQYNCAICNKSFSTKWNLKIHSWVHANRTAKPFKCEHCPKAFVREIDFKNHMNAHKQIKPYTCEYCGCKFIRKYNYMRHRREHHGNKKYTCDLCKKSFHRHYYLIEHRRIHTGERPFTCTICGKSSTTKTNHNKHLKIHHSRDPFTVEA